MRLDFHHEESVSGLRTGRGRPCGEPGPIPGSGSCKRPGGATTGDVMKTTAAVRATRSPSASGDGRPCPVGKQLRALAQASPVQLRAEWRRLFGTDPPQLSRDLLARALAYRIQEQAFGGLSRASLRRLEAPAARDGEPTPPAPLRPGTRLVREWHGQTHVVVVTEAGFDYAGSRYSSLSRIARLITGAHWSGPRFFGTTARKAGESADA